MFDSKISINNLGPIEKATINLKNLTVFVGQNNTGKTYLLSCLYFFQSNDLNKYWSCCCDFIIFYCFKII